MSITTPRLVAQYQEAVLGNELGYVSRRQLNTIKRGLIEQQKKLNRRAELARARREAAAEAERQRRIAAELAAMARKEEERRAKKREQALVRRDKRKVNVLFNEEVADDPFTTIIRVWKTIKTFGSVRAITPTGEFEIFATASSKDFVRQFFVGSVTDGVLKINPGDKLMVVAPSKLNAVRIRQLFRDGISHCVFTPILSKLEGALKNTTSKDSKTRLKQKIAKICILSKEYEAGVPVDDMEIVAKACGFKILINDILGREIYTFNDAGKSGTLIFTNTRPHHIDEGKIVLDSDSVKVDANMMRKKWQEVRINNEFYMIEGDLVNNEPRKIRTLNEVYELYDPNKEYYDAMNELAQVNKCKFNATKHPEVNEFIKAGRIINAWVTPFSDDKPSGYIDMPKAYTQFKKCEWYSGFLGVVHQWRTGVFDRKFLEEHIGIYKVRVSCKDPLFNKLGIVDGVHILPSPEILYFMDNGVECSIDAGVWGSRMDFEFPDYMLEDRRYAVWSGKLSMEHTSKKYSFHCEKDWAEHLKVDYGDDCFYWEDKKLCSVRIPNKQIFTTHHILAFITSYVRIQMMEAMKKFDISKIVKVVLDGIFFTGAKPMGLEWFREKDISQHSYRGFEWYSDEIMNVDWTSTWISKNTLLTGQGGAGKTYKVLNDACFNRILFVTPQHLLGYDISQKYSVPYTTIHKLIGEGCEPYSSNHSYPPVILIDEVTQISADWIDKVFKMYKDSLLIFAGDLNAHQWFQCRNGRPGEFSAVWKPVGVDIVEIAGDRRSRDDELRKLKLDIRAEMKRVFIDGDSSEVVRMKMWAMKNLKLTKFEDGVKMFTAGDVWIAGTHATSQKLLDNGVCSGWYKTGGDISPVEKDGFTKRGSFTIHSYQGKTIETGKIFISINDLFEYAMLYTAVSRAVEFKQLIFIG